MSTATKISSPTRGRQWTKGVDDAVENLLDTNDQEIATLILTDIMLLAAEVLS